MNNAAAPERARVRKRDSTGPAPNLPVSDRMPRSPESPPPLTIEGQIESAVERAVQRVLGPYLGELSGPEPAVYTVAQAAVVIQVSEDTVARLVKRGVLPRLPHLDGKVLIPRAAVERLLTAATQD